MIKKFEVIKISDVDDIESTAKMNPIGINTKEAAYSSQLPILSFRNLVLEIHGSLLLRDLMFSYRPITGAWAMSNRELKFTEDSIALSSEFTSMFSNVDSGIGFYNECAKKSIELQQSGKFTDEAKRSLHLGTQTKFRISITYRALVNFMYTLKVHAKKFFAAIEPEFSRGCEINFNDNSAYVTAVDMWNCISITPEESEFTGIKTLLDSSIISATIRLNLAAQMVRLHTSNVKLGLYNLIQDQTLDKVASYTCDNKTQVVVYGRKDMIDHLLSKRTCWFAQFDNSDDSSWSYILGPAIETYSGVEFLKNLPCHGCKGKCDIKNVNQHWINLHSDEKLPCPILLEDPSLIRKRYDLAVKNLGSASPILKAWMRSRNKIKLNLSNEDQIKYNGG